MKKTPISLSILTFLSFSATAMAEEEAATEEAATEEEATTEEAATEEAATEEAATEEAATEEAPAEDDKAFTKHGVFGGVGFSGLSLGYSYNASDKFTLAFMGVYMPPGVMVVDDTFGGVSFPCTTGSGSIFGAMANYRFAKNLRAVGGIGINSMSFVFDSKNKQISGNADYGPMAFYGGLGWGLKPVKGFSPGVDIGAVYTGAPDVHFDTEPADGAVRTDAEAHFWSVFPAIQLSVSYGL